MLGAKGNCAEGRQAGVQVTAYRQAVVAGAAYFALVFTAGFVLGTVRVLLLLPRLGEGPAVALELPVMLVLSWFASAFVTARLAVPRAGPVRALMGLSAFGLLMLAEAALALMLGRGIGEHLASYGEPAKLAGLAAQAVFAAIPSIQAKL